MTELVSTTLENEMDLILAYKKSIKTAEQIGLTISTQTAFATAVSEVCREVIDKAFDGVLQLGVANDGGRFQIMATITFVDNDNLKSFREGFEYAKKLVPTFEYFANGNDVTVELKLGIPRSAKMDQRKVNDIKRYFELKGPINPYEEVKLKNVELNKLYEEREMALTHANYLNKQKDEFLSVASHELNTPLTVLTTLAQLASRMEAGKDVKLHEFLSKIEIQSSKLKALISQLLVISKIESGQPDYKIETVNANNFVTICVDLIKHFVPDHVVDLQLDDTNCSILIDKLRMEQVLNNLVSNAAKYSKKGSKILITTAGGTDDFCVNVQDHGIGMSEETTAKVFTKFYRSEDVTHRYRGLGMGLYIASRIVQDHNGQILIKSKEGQGSTFTICLPIAQLLN
ncbi:MAG TPA: sensor histidine kinase [Mucilaginibacter sp.]|nr:sensor histidine kinase [Mucilaginibacter sp.]HVW15344.1 sensor histidine kinase [Mucilaginibacter sp.]